MDKKRIAVIFGGCSSEYPVSLNSAYSVITNIDSGKYDVILIGITRSGRWFRFYGKAEAIADDTWANNKKYCVPALISPDRELHGMLEFSPNGVTAVRLDAVFPVLHGKNGEDGTVQGLCELAGIPLIGCGTLSSALCMDKDKAHKLVSLCGIDVPRSVVLRNKSDVEALPEYAKDIPFPLFVKPVRAGSSFGITKVSESSALLDAVNAAFVHDSDVIIEENIDGFEVGCAVMGNGALIIGEVDEIELSEGFFDYTEKYTMKTSKIHMPARIDAETAERVKAAAAVIYRALGCRGFARVDMFLTPEGRIVFNEVNTIPGFTHHSRYPSMMKGAGLSLDLLLDKLIRVGIGS
jgi:D-alanine---D-serine ligase